MGHYSAAAALADDLKNHSDNANVIVEDIFEYTLKKYCRFLYCLFNLFVGKRIYKWTYRHKENTRSRFPLKKLFLKSFDNLIKETNAEVIISTFPTCSQLVSDYKQATGRKLLLITCITDVTSHEEWLSPLTDIYLAAAPRIKVSLIQKGIPAYKILVSGIPVKSRFNRERSHIEATPKKLLIMGGSLGMLPKSRSFYERLNKLPRIRTTIITGKNKTLYNKLHGRFSNIIVLAYVNDVYRYMHDADIIISKPGGITLYEAIFAEIPLLMFRPFLKQEIQNSEFAMENSLGIVLPKKTKKSIEEIQNIISDRKLLDDIRFSMNRFKTCLDVNALSRYLNEYGKIGALT